MTFEEYWRDASDGLGAATPAEMDMMRAWAMDAFNAGVRSALPEPEPKTGSLTDG